jgi:hypothetical protein
MIILFLLFFIWLFKFVQPIDTNCMCYQMDFLIIKKWTRFILSHVLNTYRLFIFWFICEYSSNKFKYYFCSKYTIGLLLAFSYFINDEIFITIIHCHYLLLQFTVYIDISNCNIFKWKIRYHFNLMLCKWWIIIWYKRTSKWFNY